MEPNQTLYIKNLNDKVNKDELKRALYQLFAPHGYIYEITTSKRPKLRGQAFIVFDSTASSSSALHSLQSFNLFTKPMEIQYARSQSDVVAQVQGKYDLNQSKQRQVFRHKEKFNRVPQPAPSGLQTNTLKVVEGAHLGTELLEKLFEQYPGFQAVRLEENMALVYFNNTENAQRALAGLHGFRVTDDFVLSLNFAKKEA